MFLRRFHKKAAGKRHTYWALVESVRTPKGSRQRIVAYIGELTAKEQSGWSSLGRKLSKKDRPQPSLFDVPAENPDANDEPMLVRMSGVRFERLRDFGDVWLALGLWRLLDFEKVLQKLLDGEREEVPWSTVAAILTIARFCEPSSELHIEDTWYRRTALEDLLGVSVEKVHTDRLYAGMDRLLPHKEAIEKHLKNRLGDLFGLDYELLLYDVTSTYFEGACATNPIAMRGYSRDSRPDCLQICIGLVVTTDGMPIGYEIFPGNRNDVTTLEEIVGAMEAKYGRANRVWVFDRGIVSEKNLAFLREREDSYIVGTPKAMLRQFEAHLTEKDWVEVREGIQVKLVPGPDGLETFLLARSNERREKERAMHDRFLVRMEAGLQRLQKSAESGRLRDPGVANRRLGRMQNHYWRAAKAFDVQVETLQAESGKARLKVSWTRNERWAEWSGLTQGCYLLRSNLTGVDPATLWKRYIQLTEAEWAFRIHKDELGLRPIWHQKEDRVRTHVLVSFLAYVLWKTLGHWMRAGGLGDAPRKLVEDLANIKSGDVVLPALRKSGEPEKLIRLRCVTEPDAAQKVLLSRLGIQVPRRLKRLHDVVPM
jgi:transposase